MAYEMIFFNLYQTLITYPSNDDIGGARWFVLTLPVISTNSRVNTTGIEAHRSLGQLHHNLEIKSTRKTLDEDREQCFDEKRL